MSTGQAVANLNREDASALPDMDEDLTGAMDVAGLTPEAPDPGYLQNAAANRQASADATLEQMQVGAQKIIDGLTVRRNATVDHMRAELAQHADDTQATIASLDAQQKQALDVARLASEQASALREELRKHVETQNAAISAETATFDKMILAQKRVIEATS